MYKLTTSQANEINGFEYEPQIIVTPILDADNEYVISEEIVNDLILESYPWVASLPTKPYKPK